MVDFVEILDAVDRLSGDELEVLYQRVSQRRRTAYRIVPGKSLKALAEIFAPLHAVTAQMDEDEVFAVFDEALDEVRREAANHRN